MRKNKGMLGGYDADSNYVGLSYLSGEYETTYLDPSFQRNGGVERGSGWTKAQSTAYMSNLINHKTCNLVIRASVEHCLAYAKAQKDEESLEYFTKVDNEGYEFVSIDGNNSSSTIHHFLQDKVEAFEPLSGKKKKFSNFSEVEQNDIRFVDKITVLDLRKISYKEMCYLFRNLNTQTKLNAQEYRQAMPTELSKFVRELANSEAARKMFRNMIYSKSSDLDQRSHEEFIAKYCLKIDSNYTKSITKKPLDSMYENQSDLDDNVKKHCKKILNEVIKISDEIGDKQTQKLKIGVAFLLFDLIAHVDEQGYLIKDHEKFYEAFLEMDAELEHASKSVIQEEVKEKSYSEWLRLLTDPACYNSSRYAIQTFFSVRLEELLKQNVVKRRRTSRDQFNFEDKKALFSLQDAKDRNEDKIRILDLYFGKYEADHVVSVRDGGKTELSNAELMKKEDNRKKGSSSNEPYFEHQMEFGF